MSLRVASRSRGVGGKTRPCRPLRPARGGVRGLSVPGDSCPARTLSAGLWDGRGGPAPAVRKHNYGQSDRPVQYSIDRFTLATWSPRREHLPARVPGLKGTSLPSQQGCWTQGRREALCFGSAPSRGQGLLFSQQPPFHSAAGTLPPSPISGTSRQSPGLPAAGLDGRR